MGTCAPPVVISQYYSAGGNNNATLNADYVELHNRSGQAVSIAGWSIQYAPGGASGNFGGMQDKVDLPAVSIPAGGYFLVEVSEPDPVDGAPLPTPDFSFDIGMGANNGKIALVNTTTLLPAQLCVATDPTVIDLIGYGSAGNEPTCWENNPAGSYATGQSVTDAGFRGGAGCNDTGNNANDFAGGAAAPRNSATAPLVCSCP